jgi:hypothetical protein
VDKVEAEKLLAEHLALYRAQSYAELARQVGSVVASQVKGPSGTEYNVEILILWDLPDRKTNVRVMAAVDDGHWSDWFRPSLDSFIVAPDGSFVGEEDLSAGPPRVPRYFRRAVADPRADEFDAWGTCETFFEFDQKGQCLRQVERYQNGFVLKYDATHQQDEYGGISDPSDDLTDEFEISVEQFERVWLEDALNRR